MLPLGETASSRGGAARCARAGGGRRVLLGCGFVGVATVVGNVKAAAFENKAGTRTDEALYRASTFSLRTIREMGVLHGLARLKAVSAGLAFVVVSRHNRIFR